MIALIIAILIALWLLRPQPAAPVIEIGTPAAAPSAGLTPGTSSKTTVVTPVAPVEQPATAPEPAAPPDERGNLKRLASAFAERLGSYSNQSNFDNILDLKVFMTSTMAAWADKYAAQQRANQGDAAVYFGVTTRAISTDVASFEDAAGKARITVKTQRNETKGDGSAPRVYYQDLRVDFLKLGDTWKIDGAYWQ
ncbi:MAG: hypothetical protein AAB692_02720 [Patescibacteria group bacterium]